MKTGTHAERRDRNSGLLLRRSQSDPSAGTDPVDTVRAPGKALNPATREYAEPRFGFDFSRVRIHDDSTAASSAARLGARAYTSGSDIAFASGAYRPDAGAGLHLLLHELTHVAQQSGSLRGDIASSERDAQARAASIGSARVSPMRAPTTTGHLAVQRFEEEEHRDLGDKATGSAKYEIGGKGGSLQLTHGDIVMLSGDWFAPDELFRLAALPGKNGSGVGTRDEVLAALKMIKPSDTRFAKGGQWDGFTPNKLVVDAVNQRFQTLAAANASHFAAPAGRSATGAALPAAGGSAGSTYRKFHEAAIIAACSAGETSAPIDAALAREAAAQHFLTDAFSAGHLRTPVESMRDYWKAKYPLFFYNLLHKIALDTAIEMNRRESNLTAAVATVQMMYEGIMEQVQAMAATLPEVTLGDLLARVFHDVDNKAGVEIVGGGLVFGDSHLDDPNPRNVTRSRATAAIIAGNKDVSEAYKVGQNGQKPAPSALFAEVQKVTSAPPGQFLPETMMPVPATSAPQQNWKGASFETLWNQPVTGTSGIKIGDKIKEELLPGSAIRKQLDDLAERFPKKDPHFAGDLHPQAAYKDGFVRPLVADPYRGILGIINWAPNYGLRGVDRDDISLATGRELDKRKPGEHSRLEGMTTPARVKYIRELIDGWVAGDEQDLVVRIFQTAPKSERRLMYERIEGHPWKGDWIEGFWVSDDDLWNALSRRRLDVVKALINEK